MAILTDLSAATLFIALATASSAAEPVGMAPQIKPGAIIAPLAAVTIYVRDMNASLALYRDELKMHVLSDEPSSVYGPGRTVTLGVSPKPVGHIILVDLGAKGGPAPAHDRAPYGHSGDFAVVIPTDHIWDIYNRLHTKYVFMSPPVSLMFNPKAKVQGVEMSFRDNDNVYVNVVQPGVMN
jgi:catechol 2,3-dioxygenase-like lactoylglutathione lyase family enzyme